ncbi:MAG: hypothetical protein QM648_02180 [Solirubrobacterales bacterium]
MDARHRTLAVAISAFALLVLPCSAGAVTLTIPLPSSGTATTAVFTESVPVTSRQRASLPARLPVLASRAKSLPSSIRLIYARGRVVKRHTVTYGLLLVAVNNANGASPLAPQKKQNVLKSLPSTAGLSAYTKLKLAFRNPPSSESYGGGDSTSSMDASGAAGPSVAVEYDVNTDIFVGTSNFVTDARKELKGLLANQTGAIDNGRAFPWKLSNASKRKAFFGKVLSTPQLQITSLVALLERGGGLDLNGNSLIDEPVLGTYGH